VAVLALVAAGGCLSAGSGPLSDESGENVTVEYGITASSLPSEIASANLTMQVVFVENGDDFSDNACWRDTYFGPFKPTPTPIGEPSGDCLRSQEVTVDVTELNETRTVTATAPERFDAGHGLVVTDVVATYQNGTSVSRIHGFGGHRANIVEGTPEDRYTVDLGIGTAETPAYAYYLSAEENSSGR
jgi:hypothetical protein